MDQSRKLKKSSFFLSEVQSVRFMKNSMIFLNSATKINKIAFMKKKMIILLHHRWIDWHEYPCMQNYL